MKVIPISRYRFFQALQPISVLTKVTSKYNTGCLQVFSPLASWSIYFQDGKLVYACQDNKFEMLDRKLHSLRTEIPTLPSKICEQLQAIFETCIHNEAIINPDYLAICWLVNNKYLSFQQAGILVENLVLEVMESFLKLEKGSYEFIPESFFNDLPKFCYLDWRLLVSPYEDSSYNQHQNQTINNNLLEQKVYSIICIDDHAATLNTVRSFLDQQTFLVTGIKDPLEAIVQIIQIKPDIILLATEMPELNGYQVCSFLRKNSSFQDTPIIMMTDKLRFSDRFKARFLRISGWLTKPFTQKDLLKILFQYID